MIEDIQRLIQGTPPLIYAATEISTHDSSIFTSFTTTFLTILVCEIGDKTFFLAMIMAMKYNKLVVFIGSWGALAIMTVLSAVFGKVIFSLIPKFYTNLIVTLLFFYFGAKLIYEAYQYEEHAGEN
jgi:putative Ca2+/H+ antiporter (TMEM165/GDT1 family)